MGWGKGLHLCACGLFPQIEACLQPYATITQLRRRGWAQSSCSIKDRSYYYQNHYLQLSPLPWPPDTAGSVPAQPSLWPGFPTGPLCQLCPWQHDTIEGGPVSRRRGPGLTSLCLPSCPGLQGPSSSLAWGAGARQRCWQGDLALWKRTSPVSSSSHARPLESEPALCLLGPSGPSSGRHGLLHCTGKRPGLRSASDLCPGPPHSTGTLQSQLLFHFELGNTAPVLPEYALQEVPLTAGLASKLPARCSRVCPRKSFPSS